MTAVYSTTIDGRIRKTAITSYGDFHLSYILIEEMIADDLGDGRHTFSVFVAMCGEDGQKDSILVRDVTESFDLANELFTLISECAVTPCTLLDVTEDFLGSH